MTLLSTRLVATAITMLALASCGDDGSASASGTVPPTRAVDPAPTDGPSLTVASPTTVASPAASAGAGGNTVLDSIDDQLLLFQRDGFVRTALRDGSEDRAVADAAPAGQEQPDWSPAGGEVAFQTDFATLWTAEVDGGGATAVFECTSPCAAIMDPAWSPDGSEIAFATAETADGTTTSRAAIVALDVDTGNVRTMYEDTSGVVWLFAPRWSPDGASIVFEEDTFASNLLSEESTTAVRLATFALDGSAPPEQIAVDGATPDWSPLDDLIGFSRDGNLFLVGTDGSGERPLTDFDGVEQHAIQPTFAPDGTGIVFTFVTGTFDVDDEPTAAVIGLDGSGFQTLDIGPSTHPRLQP